MRLPMRSGRGLDAIPGASPFFLAFVLDLSARSSLALFFDDTLQSEYKIRSLNSQVPQNDWGIMKNALALLLSAVVGLDFLTAWVLFQRVLTSSLCEVVKS